MIIRDRIRSRYPSVSNEEWRKNLRRDFLKTTIFCVTVWLISAAFTVWLLWR